MTATDPALLTPWVQYVKPVPGVRVVLLCFPHAGGSASSYRDWVPKLADRGIEVWPVQLPGRENRFSEPFVTDLAAVTKILADVVLPELGNRPYAVFGHSAGTGTAYAFARHMAVHGRPLPVHLFLSGARPPSDADPDFPLHLLDPDAFLRRLFEYGRMPAEVLKYSDMAQAMADTARADLRLVETYRWPDEPALDCPVTPFGGVEDATVPVEVLPRWQLASTRAVETVVLPGGHFPAADGQQRILEVVRRALSEY